MKTLVIIGFLFSLTFSVSAQSTVVSDSTIFTVVEQMPEFPGGDDGLLKYISKNLKYPQGDYSCRPDTQYFTFIIEKDGSVSNVKSMRETKCKMHDDMVINTLKAMPNWKPGMQNGKPARVQYNLPMKIHLR